MKRSGIKFSLLFQNLKNKERKIINTKLGLLELGRQLRNVSRACKLLGFSRDTFISVKNFMKQEER